MQGNIHPVQPEVEGEILGHRIGLQQLLLPGSGEDQGQGPGDEFGADPLMGHPESDILKGGDIAVQTPIGPGGNIGGGIEGIALEQAAGQGAGLQIEQSQTAAPLGTPDCSQTASTAPFSRSSRTITVPR